MHKLLACFLLISLGTNAQLERARTVTETLCSPGFHGRGYVNAGDSIAAEYIATQYKEAGCSFFPQGIFQSFSFNVNTFPGDMQLFINGKELKPGVDYIVNEASGGGSVVKQQVYKFPLESIFNESLLNAELKTLGTATDPNGEKLYPVVMIQLTGMKGDSLKKASKLAVQLTADYTVLQVNDTKFTWSVSDEQYKHPLIHVQQSAIDLSEDKHVVDFTIDAVLRKHTARNVIAYAPAKRRNSKKYIVYTAHYDHLGRMGQQTYFPGANDNASGTAMLLELAHYFVEHPMKKTNVVFMSFAGEEAGLIGSRYYVEHPLFPLEKIKFLTNVDIMGSGEEGITVVNATKFPAEFAALQQINKNEEYLVKIGSRGPAANSDHYFFTEAGVPAFFFYTMGPNKHYHDVEDTYKELSFSEFGDLYRLLIDFAGVLK